MTNGETDLHKLISAMSPDMLPEKYVFCCLPVDKLGKLPDYQAKAMFLESEGMSLVLPEETAKHHRIAYQGVYRCITLSVHSSLEAVGLTAAFATALSKQGISANVIAGYHHDHIFVPQSDAENALQTLQALSQHGLG